MEKALDRVTAALVATMVGLMVVIILASVFTRYVLNDPLGWAEQVTKYLMIWAAFLGASLGIKEGSHIAVNVIVDLLPEKAQRVCFYLGYALTASFLLVATYQGVKFAYNVRENKDFMVGDMSMAWPYAAIPVGCVLMLIQLGLLCAKGNPTKLSNTASLT